MYSLHALALPSGPHAFLAALLTAPACEAGTSNAAVTMRPATSRFMSPLPPSATVAAVAESMTRLRSGP